MISYSYINWITLLFSHIDCTEFIYCVFDKTNVLGFGYLLFVNGAVSKTNNIKIEMMIHKRNIVI